MFENGSQTKKSAISDTPGTNSGARGTGYNHVKIYCTYSCATDYTNLQPPKSMKGFMLGAAVLQRNHLEGSNCAEITLAQQRADAEKNLFMYHSGIQEQHEFGF